MRMNETALGRLVPEFDVDAVVDDAVLDLLLRFWAHPQNPANAFFPRSRIAHALAINEATVATALERLTQRGHAEQRHPGFEYRITPDGIRFAKTMPQGLASVL